jgi:hypothetical protein
MQALSQLSYGPTRSRRKLRTGLGIVKHRWDGEESRARVCYPVRVRPLSRVAARARIQAREPKTAGNF